MVLFSGVAGGREATDPVIEDLTFYHHGDPTELEQLMLELVNRARANPGAEAARLGINLNTGLSPGEITDTPKQPIGFHRALIDAARGHSQWMMDHNIFSHTGEGGSTASERAMAAGYPSGAGENITMHWTEGPIETEASTRGRHEGLFISPGHRKNICYGPYREIGLGILSGHFLNGSINYNALSVTQDFGLSNHTPWPFVVGVAYYDFNGNSFYDPGESIGGIEVNVDGGTYHTTTAPAGGYTLPRPSPAGMRIVSFTDGVSEINLAANMASGVNHKVDLALAYTPPVLSGPAAPVVGQDNPYTISPVTGATRFDVTAYAASPASFDGADNLSRVIDGTSATYPAVSTTVKHEGGGAYRFAHPEYQDQILEYAAEFLIGPAATIKFRSRMRLATGYQIAHLEVTDDGGMNWTAVYSQAGSGGLGESSFLARSASLASYSGKVVRIRFRYEVGVSYYRETSDHVGWYVDVVEFDQIDSLMVMDEKSVLPGSTYPFVPPQEGIAVMVARPRNSDRLWPHGPPLVVDAKIATAGYDSWASDWEIAGGLAPGTLSNHPGGDFSGDGVANILAYGMGFNPLSSALGKMPGWSSPGDDQVFDYTVNTEAVGVAVAPELSTDLKTWHPPGAPALGFASADVVISLEGTLQRRRVVFSNGPPPSVYARVGAKQE